MTRHKILNKVLPVSDVIVEDFYDSSAANDWELKTRRIEARRWRKLKHQLV